MLASLVERPPPLTPGPQELGRCSGRLTPATVYWRKRSAGATLRDTGDERDELEALAARLEAVALDCGPDGAASLRESLDALRDATAEIARTEC